jgi:transcriptional regulator with XRE-family HTH domain
MNPQVERVLQRISARELAYRLGISVQAIQKWKQTGVPIRKVWLVAELTDIPAHELRPDIVMRPNAQVEG